MKRTISLLMCLVLALGMGTMGATADESVVLPAFCGQDVVTKTMYGFEGTAGTDVAFQIAGVGHTLSLVDATTEEISGAGISGQALKIAGENTTTGTWKFARVNTYEKAGGQTNWNGALAWEVYVDTSASDTAVSLRAGFMGTSSSGGGDWGKPKAGSQAYLLADAAESSWTAATVDGNSFIPLPVGFKGWVRIGLDNDHVIGEGGTANVALATSMYYVTVIHFEHIGTASPVYIDTVRCVYFEDERSTVVEGFEGAGEITFRDWVTEEGGEIAGSIVAAADEGVTGNGIAGKVLKLVAPEGFECAKLNMLNLNNMPNMYKNWEKASAFEMYVDASKETTNQVKFATGGNNAGGWYDLNPGAVAQICADGGEWTNVTVDADRTITLPVGFKGWVRVTIFLTSFAAGPWGGDGPAAKVAAGFSSTNQLTFMVGNTTQPVYVDSVRAVYTTLAGDANGDDAITATDARQVLKAIVGNTTLAGKAAASADFNGDGKLTTLDARKILRAAVGKA